MPKTKFTHEQIVDLAEVEPTDQEEWSDIYREWKKLELQDLWIEIKQIEEQRLRKMHKQRDEIEKLLGKRLNVRLPRNLVEVPNQVAELLESA